MGIEPMTVVLETTVLTIQISTHGGCYTKILEKNI